MARKNHLDAAVKHRRRAFIELKRLAADSALHWILSHKDRVSKFRRAIKDTSAAAPFNSILGEIRKEATVLPKTRAKPRATAKVRRRRARRATSRPAYGTFF